MDTKLRRALIWAKSEARVSILRAKSSLTFCYLMDEVSPCVCLWHIEPEVGLGASIPKGG